MSGSKRKATNTGNNSSSSKRNSIGTRARKVISSPEPTRMRTRGQVKAERAISEKRPKLRHDTRQDNVFAIKDIVDEKFIHGKRHYKIDWQDDPNTGESFSPTWVCHPSSQKSRTLTNHLCRSLRRTPTRTLSRTGNCINSAESFSVSPRRRTLSLNPLRPQRLVKLPLVPSSLSCNRNRIS